MGLTGYYVLEADSECGSMYLVLDVDEFVVTGKMDIINSVLLLLDVLSTFRLLDADFNILLD